MLEATGAESVIANVKPMPAAVAPSQRVHRILRASPLFIPPLFRFGRRLPKDVTLAPGDELIGGIWGGKLEAILTSRGAYFRAGSAWRFVAFADIEDVSFPEKSDSGGALRIAASSGNFELLAGRSELWDVGRFFVRCAEDAKSV